MSDLREWAHIHIGGKNIMNKKLLALLAVAAMGISIAGATPQTQFNKGEFQLDLGASAIDHIDAGHNRSLIFLGCLHF